MDPRNVRHLTHSKSSPSFSGLAPLPTREAGSRRHSFTPTSQFPVDRPEEFGPERVRSILRKAGRTELSATRMNGDVEEKLIYSFNGVRLNRILQGGVFNYNLLFKGNSAFFEYGQNPGSRELYSRFLTLARDIASDPRTSIT